MFGQRTTGAGNDIEEATDLARKMVTEWGMSERIGPVYCAGGKDTVFLGLEMARGAVHRSDEMAEMIDAETSRIVSEQHDRAVQILSSHRSVLEVVGEALLAHETLSGSDIQTLVDGGTLDRRHDLDEAEDAESDDNKRTSQVPSLGSGIAPKPEPA